MILVADGEPEGVRLSSSPSALQSPAYSQVHSWHCSGRECREGADPLSMGKNVCLRAGKEVQIVRGEEVSREIPFIFFPGL